MDAASGIAGLIAVADLVFSKVFWYVKAIKNAEKDVKSFATEIQTLAGVLYSLHILACQLEGEDFDRSIRVHHIYYCHEALEKIKTKLQKAFPVSEKPPSVSNFLNKLKWPFSAEETKDLITDIQRHKATLTLALSCDNLSGLLKALSNQDAIKDDLNEVKKELRKRWYDEDRRTLAENHQRVVSFFARVEPQHNHDTNTKLRHPGTGLWLTESPEFQHWIKTGNSRLWFYGIPGAGKTILAAAVIEEAFARANKDCAVAFFYCDYKDPASQVPINIICSLACQLAFQDSDCFDMLEAYFLSCNPNEGMRKLPDVLSVRDLILKMATHFNEVAVIVDGIDECGKAAAEVLELLLSLSDMEPIIKTLLSSRDEPHIRELLDNYTSISIAARSSDLKLYVASEIELRVRKKRLRLKSDQLKEHIMDKLVNEHDGMFRWVACQLDYLCELPNDRARRDALESLPPNLKSTYERMLHRLNNGDVHSRKIVQRTLMWLIYAIGELTASELCHAISVDLEEKELDPEAISSEDEILRCCSSFVRLTDHGFQLAHFTVKEFFMDLDPKRSPELAMYRMDSISDSLKMASTCLKYLSLVGPQNQSSTTDWQHQQNSYPFIRHSAECWQYYWQSRWSDEPSCHLVRLLFDPHYPGLTQWLLFHHISSLWYMIDDQPNANLVSIINGISVSLQTMTPLHYAALLHEPDICSFLLNSGSSSNEPSDFGLPLQLAALGWSGINDIYSYFSVMWKYKTKFSANTITWLQGSMFAPPMALAAPPSPPPGLGSFYSFDTKWFQMESENDRAIRTFRLLVKSGADWKSQLGILRIPATRIAALESPYRLESLVKAGAPIDQKTLQEFLSADFTKSEVRAHLSRILNSISVDDLDDESKIVVTQISLLVDQSASDGKEAVQHPAALLEDLTARWETLIQAVQQDRVQASEVLLKQGVDDVNKCIQMNEKEKFLSGECTLLHIAAVCSSPAILELLFQAGADLTQRTEDGLTALHLSLFDATGSKARILLDKGILASASDSRGWTAWHFASATCNLEMINALADRDPDSKSSLENTSNSGETPIDTFGALFQASDLTSRLGIGRSVEAARELQKIADNNKGNRRSYKALSGFETELHRGVI